MVKQRLENQKVTKVKMHARYELGREILIQILSCQLYQFAGIPFLACIWEYIIWMSHSYKRC